jgi:putative selenium metabolism hydrolase
MPMTPSRKEELVEFCQELVRTPSITGQEKAMANKIAAKMEQLGYTGITIDEFGSVIGKVRGQSDSPVILFDGHMDTAPISDLSAWSHDPYAAEIEDGKIYGRGAADMKGALAAMIYGIASMIQIKDQLNGTIYVSCTVCEERFEGISLGKVLDSFYADYVVIGEPSDLSLMIGQKGRAEIIIKTTGKNAHSARPNLGINAVYKMFPVIEGIKNIKLPRHDSLGEAVLELTDIISSPYPGTSVVPDLCIVTYDRRVLPGETKEEVLESIRNVIAGLAKEDPELKATVGYSHSQEVCYTGAIIEADGFFPAWLLPRDSTLVEKALSSLMSIGVQPKLGTWPFCTNGSESAGRRDIPTIGFGPGSANQAHANNEYVEITQLLQSHEGYAAISGSVLK